MLGNIDYLMNYNDGYYHHSCINPHILGYGGLGYKPYKITGGVITQVITKKEKRDEDGNIIYDENGNPEYEPNENYLNLQNEDVINKIYDNYNRGDRSLKTTKRSLDKILEHEKDFLKINTENELIIAESLKKATNEGKIKKTDKLIDKLDTYNKDSNITQKNIDLANKYQEKLYEDEKKNIMNIKKVKEYRKGKEKEDIKSVFEGLKQPYEEMKEKEETAKEFREKELTKRVGKPFIESMNVDKLENLEYFTPDMSKEQIYNLLQNDKVKYNIDKPNGLALEDLTKTTDRWGEPLKDILNDNSNIQAFEEDVKKNIPTIYHKDEYKIGGKYPWEWSHVDLTQNNNLTDSKAYIYTKSTINPYLGIDFNKRNEDFNKYCYKLRNELLNEANNTQTSFNRKNEIQNILSSKQNFENEIIRRDDYPNILITKGKITGETESGSDTMTSNIYGLHNGKPKVKAIKFSYFSIFNPNTGKGQFVPVNKLIQNNINKDFNYDMLTNDGRYVYKVLEDNNFILNGTKGKLRYGTYKEGQTTYYKVFPNKFIKSKITK